MGAKSRRKGAQYEWELAKRWRDSGLFPDAHRGGGSQAMRYAPKTCSDVEGTPYFIEAKRRKRHDIRGALRQAEEARAKAGDERAALVVARWDGDSADDAIVCMRLSDFEAMILAQREGWEAP